MPRRAESQRIERGLYEARKAHLACATPTGSRKIRCRTLRQVHLSEARRPHYQFAAEVHRTEVSELGGRATVGELSQRTYEGHEPAGRLHVVTDLGEARQREVILMWELARLLRAYRLASRVSRDGDPVFASGVGTPLNVRSLTASQRGLEKACERASLDDVTFHVLRFTSRHAVTRAQRPFS